jgi:hypothetical protein
MGLHQNVSTADIEKKPVEAGTQPPTEDWAPPSQPSQTQDAESQTDQPSKDISHPESSTQSDQPDEEEDISESLEIPADAKIKMRDACRLIRALRKVSYELRGPRPEKRKPEKRVYQAFITLEDQVGFKHLQHRIGQREELQTTLQHPHQFRKTLIRIYRLKNLIWTLFRNQDGNLTRMPELMQILEDQAEYVIRIEGFKRRRPNSPGSSKRRHFERANQKRGRQDFNWSPTQDSQKTNPRGPVKGCPEDRHQAEGDESRFIWTAPDTEPHVEPPRPEGWKPLVLTPKLVKQIADQRLSEWSKDQEEYTEKQFQEIERRKEEAERISTKQRQREEQQRRAEAEIQ